ncbi:hypothetical protein CERZMDRAFT_107546 [Cercospora zeae-maydis SCOH1-5]|uniref:DNA2/NAM7 helicase helicase domain-containing protein n=1 Tax=Cercospora zeae-maydis SCOH1-5 TaxID=717836 RepID=A0A6A6F4Q1_9PEZI|nr:hypothetical protein CERZMDRAFT_107546 [Cercospora zeae-maydis SCOH1-5]
MSSISSDSDAITFDTALTTPLSVNESPEPIKDPALDYGHLVKDPVAFGVVKDITEKSTLAKLYKFTGAFEHGTLLKERQSHDEIPEIDLVSYLDVSGHTVERAKQWLLNCSSWNEPQLKALHDMHRTRGRLQLISGPAGTGKSLVHGAQALFFVKLGGRALCTTTVNANADHQVSQLRPFAVKCGTKNVRIHRLHPSSRGLKIKDFTREQAFHKRLGHQGGNVTTLDELIFKSMSQKVDAYDMSVERGVLDDAKKGEFRYETSITNDKKALVNVGEEMRVYIKKVGENSVDWRSPEVRGRLERLYEACKGHLIRVTKIFLTNEWKRPRQRNGLSPRQGRSWTQKEIQS